MFKKISVLIPTRNRTERLQMMLNSYHATTQDDPPHSSELVFRVDNDDSETYEFLRPTLLQTVVGPRFTGYASMSVFFNELAAACSGDVLMLGNDDMLFKTPGWATKILDVANQFPDGLFDLGYRTLNESHFPFATVSRIVVDRLGFIWDPRIFWGDIYLRDIMQHFGRCVMISTVHIDHDWMGFHPDKTFSEGDRDVNSQDPTYWTTRHAPAVAEAITSLTAVLA